MPEIIDLMQEQAVYAEGKVAFIDGRRGGYNPYEEHNRGLVSIWLNGWDQARQDHESQNRQWKLSL